ncbi:hypothetical protein B2J86_03095 [Acidovorax sp. SRB_14]|nr:hypothetical protein [Acidovorax sp. SRB_24]NMM79925.1 hypothetical protein [Acidovorax sp. SRB_14]
MWQDCVVGAIVALAALYALWYWMPAALRRRLGFVRPALAEKSGCGSCSSCGGCGNAPTAASGGVPEGGVEGRKPVWMAPDR